MRARYIIIAIALISVSIKSIAQTHTVTSFLPTVASVSEVVTITGTQFDDVTDVSFGGTPAASFVIESSSTITAVVGSGSSGSVAVTKVDGTVSLAGFTYVLVPSIASVSPASGAPGTSVTITGLNFGLTVATNTVFFGAGKAVVTAASSTELTVTVPVGATFHPISVSVAGRTGYSAKPFVPTFTGGDGIKAGTFGPTADFDAGTSFSTGAAVGDLDGDGKTDVVVINADYNNPAIGVYRNTSTGPGNTSFATRDDISVGLTGANPRALAIGDLDGDGKPDVVVALIGETSVAVFRNTTTSVGTITFAAKQNFTTGATPFSVAIGDLDLDGRPDLAVANAGDDNISVLRNTNTGPGNIDFATKVDFTTEDEPRHVAIGDLDGDGKLDLVASCQVIGKISVLRNTSTGATNINFASKQDYTFTSPIGVAMGDFKASGKVDLAVVSYVGDVSVFRYNGTGPGNISYATKVDIQTGGGNRQSITTGDLDGDGKIDIATGNSNDVSVFRNTYVSGTPVSFAAGEVFALGGSNPTSVLMGDMDGDGKGDLLAPAQFDYFFSVLHNNGDITAPEVSVLSPLDNATGFAANSNLVLTFSEDVIKGSGNIVILENEDPTQTINVNTASVTISGNVVTIDPSDFTADAAVNIQIASSAFTDLAGNEYAGIADATGWNFTVAPAPPPVPTVTGFNPISAASGATVTITGTNFDNATAVSFGGTPATSFNIVSPTSITAIVASGASGDVSVTTPGGTATLAGFTFLPAPTLTSFNPTLAASGATITLTGTNFTGATAVTFGGTAAASFNVVSPTSITAVLGSGSSGSVSVTTPGGTATLAGFVMIAPPVLTSFNPTSAGTGMTVTLTGTTLSEVTSVKFGGISASSFNIVSPTSITAVVAEGGTGIVTVTSPGGSSSVAGFTFVEAPTLTSFVPTSAHIGQKVTLTGTNFTGATTVTFGGIAAASFDVLSSTSIEATLGSGTSGTVVVTTPGGSDHLAGFTYTLPTTITNFNPNSGPVGTEVTITGTNYSTTPSNNIVKFNGVTATIIGTPTITSIVVTVPPTATTGPISVEAGGETATSGTNFTVTDPDAPIVTGFSPLVGQVGTTVTITGTNFSTTVTDDVVKFNGVEATIVGTPTATSIVTTVPSGATTGTITVDVAGQTATSSTNFIVAYAPVITSLNPASGPVGTSVIITGTDFGPTVTTNTVYFGPTKATVTGVTSTTLTVTVPAGATFQPITVLANGLVGYSRQSFLPTFDNGDGIKSATFGPRSDFATGSLAQSAAVGDLDGDGKSDVVISNQSDHTIGVYRNTSTGTGNTSFATREDISTGASSAPNSVAIGDLDGDGKLDVVVAKQAGGVSVFRNTSPGPGSITFAAKVDFTSASTPYWVAIGDFDGDGKSDLAVANFGSASVSILRSTSTGAGNISFTAKVDFTTATGPRHLAIGDLDGDGRLDLAVACTDGDKISVLRNTGTATIAIDFAAKADFTGTLPYSVAIGDLNGNGTADLAAVNYSTNTVSVFRYNGSGAGNISYAAPLPFATGNNPTSVTMGDMDGDGKIDLAIANQSSQSVSVLRNTNTGTSAITFATGVNYTTEQNPGVVVVGDMDNDGKGDLVVSTQLGFLSVLLNNGDAIAPQVTALSPLDDAIGFASTSNLVLTFDEAIIKGTGNIIVREEGDITQTINVTAGNVTISGTVVTINPSDFTEGALVNIEIAAGAFTDLSGNNYGGIADATAWNFQVASAPPPVPTITSFNPTSSASGGTVTITGTNLTGATAVSFGGIASTSFNIVSATSITGVVATGASGDVSVTTPGGTATLAGFAFLPAPTLTSFNPTSALPGATVTLVGTNFTGATAVTFGGTSATSFNVVSPTSITAVVGSGSSGSVSVTTPGGTATLAGFTILAAPAITSFNPTSAGLGATVTLTGTNFVGATSVSFGGSEASSFTVVSPTSITAVVSTGSSGDVSVTTSSGTGTLAGFVFIAAPTLTSFTPTNAGAGATVTLTGTNFTGATAVTFGGTPAASFNVVSPTSITAVLASGSTGTVAVTTAGGMASLAGFTFVVPLTINNFNPISGPVGTSVTITGTSFSTISANNVVKFNGVVAGITGTPTTTSIVTSVPAGATTGLISVEVGAETATSSSNFTVTAPGSPTITGFSPAIGPIGTSVTISGTNFSTTAIDNIVKFNGVVATITGTPTATSIVTIVPSGATTGAITVEVDGLTATSALEFIVGDAPYIAAFSPMSGPVGTSVTITGTDFSATPANNIVYFGATKAVVSAATTTTLSVTVPVGATFQPISVLTHGLIGYSLDSFLPTFAGGTGIVSNSFTDKTDFATGSLSQSVAIGDLDGDGKSDVVVSNQEDHTISVLRNTSTGSGNTSFATREDISTGANSSPNSVAIGDLDGDGKLDVVVARQFGAGVSVYRNTTTSAGTISFAAKLDFATGTNPYWVAIGDLDGDGKSDLAVANSGSASVSILRSTSTGAGNIDFAAKVDITTANNPRSIAIGNLDRDGNYDLAVACTDGNAISVLRNTSTEGNISFAAKLDFTGTLPYSVAIGDVNGDSNSDLAVVNYSSNTVSVFRYNGTGPGNISYAAKVDYTTGNNPTSVTMGDLDGDGKIDLVTANQSLESVSVFRNTNTGTSVSFANHVTFATAENPSVAAIGDLDGDGKSDLVVSTQFDFLSVLLNGGDVTTPLATSFSPADDAAGVFTTSNLVITFDEDIARGSGSIVVREDGDITQTIDVSSAGVSVSGAVVTINPSDFTQGVTVNIEIAPGAFIDLAGNDYAGIADATTWNFDILVGAQPAPTISSFNPTSSASGATVTITGTNFSGVSAVSFGGTAATSFNEESLTNLTAVVGAGASGDVSVTTPGGTATLAGFTFIQTPTITNVNPLTGPVGSSVTITGTNFSTTAANNTVKFNGVVATVTGTPTATSIVTSVPVGATTGAITVEVNGLTATSSSNFTVTIPNPPTITNFSPISGQVGATVTITGTHFSTTALNNIVKFNGVAATITGTPTTTSIVTTVPAGATTGVITVEVDGQVVTSSEDFTVIPLVIPTITGFTPASGPIGTDVTITGTNFSTTAGDNIVRFNGALATVTGTPTQTSIQTVVPLGATTGKITVEIPGQTATSANDFTVTTVSLVQITNVTSPISFTKGGTMTVSVTVNDATKVTTAKLVTRGISESSSDAVSTSVTAIGNKFEKVIAATDLTDPIGLVYYFELVDLNDIEITSTATNAYPVFASTSTEQQLPGLSFGVQVSNYQIIAFPFLFTNNAATSVLGALGTYDKTKWRLFDFSGGDNREYPAFNTIDPGKGYWLIVKNNTTINPGAGQTVSAASTAPFSIPIVAGWNLIGNPYNFRISWDDVLAANTDISGLGNKVQVFSGGTLTESSVIDKFRGAFIFSGAAGSLEIPVTRNTTIGGRTKDEPSGRFALDQSYWQVPLMLSDGILTNELGGIGMHPSATLTGKDEFDQVTVPLPDGLSLFGLSTPHPELHATFSREVVPTTENFKWNFDVKGTAGKQVVIRWDNSYFGDNDKELVLFDPASMQLIDMRSVNQLALTDRMTNITVLFGSRDFIDNEMDDQLPLLGTPYPVPAQAEVTIPFRVPKSAGWANVNIRIYDAKGVLVNTPVDKDMAPGHYEVKCQPTGTGMYVVRMEIAGKPSQLAKIIIY